MILIAGTLRIHPDMQNEAVETFQWMTDNSKAEAGCITYSFYQDPQDSTLFFVFEQWEDETTLLAHSRSAHMVEFRKQRAGFIAGDVHINRYDVTDVKPA